jgi:predicted MPP superfamily phosphohydrolase
MTMLIDLGSQGEKGSKKLLWTTDLHLDAAEKEHLKKFFQEIVAHDPIAILIGGDICNGSRSLVHLKSMAEQLKKPLYFVLGNHDFYYGSISSMRQKAHLLTEQTPHLIYLTESGVIELSPTTALIGHDGWYDGKAGDFLRSDMLLNDYFLIDELKNLAPERRLAKLNELGAEAGHYLRKALNTAFRHYKKVILLTHVPPFLESCVHEGAMCDANRGPHFVSQTTGEGLLEEAQAHPDKQLLVLCGHTHAAADVKVLPNLRVLTGGTVLGAPSIQGILTY